MSIFLLRISSFNFGVDPNMVQFYFSDFDISMTDVAINDISFWDFLDVYNSDAEKIRMKECAEVLRLRFDIAAMHDCGRLWSIIGGIRDSVIEMVEKIKSVAQAHPDGRDIDILLVLHGTVRLWEDGLSEQSLILSMLNRFLSMKTTPPTVQERLGHRILITCGASGQMNAIDDNGWIGCFEGTDGDRTAVNWTPFGLWAKSLRSRHSLHRCYSPRLWETSREDFLTHVCWDNINGISDSSHGIDFIGFEGIDKELC